MLLYHRTDASEAILTQGFRDGEGTYGTGQFFRGVWLSDRPLDCNEGAFGDTVLVLDIPEEVVVEYEWVEEEKYYREFLIPGLLINTYGTPKVCNEEDLDRAYELDDRWLSETLAQILA